MYLSTRRELRETGEEKSCPASRWAHPQSDEVRLPSPAKDLGSDYSTITLVGEDNTLTLYLDGEEIAETEHPVFYGGYYP